MEFQPNYQNLVNCARNIEAPRIPLYEHIICTTAMEQILGCCFSGLLDGSFSDKQEFFRQYCRFFQEMGYDTVSFEQCIGPVMPGNGALGGHKEGVVKTREDFERYPWASVPDRFFERYGEDFCALASVIPEGMKAVGGPGNGIFECVQDIVGYTQLCYLSVDDPELYADLFRKVGETNLAIWERFLERFSDLYCVVRFGDDLGYKNNTLLSAGDIRTHVIPQYRRIIEAAHRRGKPFLLHSCGCIFPVMEDLIAAGIDAKHSNEDQIARFPEWVRRYGDRIGNFGGIDTDAVCRLSETEMREYISDVVSQCRGHGGFAFGSGNSIPDYVPVEGYRTMVRILRELRGDDLRGAKYL